MAGEGNVRKRKWKQGSVIQWQVMTEYDWNRCLHFLYLFIGNMEYCISLKIESYLYCYIIKCRSLIMLIYCAEVLLLVN